MADPPTGTVTFLYTDTEGAGRMWEEQPQAARAALGRLFASLRQAVEEHRGHVFRTQDDGLCAAFASAPDAVAAAAEAQRQLEGTLEALGALRARMAVHTGS